MGKNADQKNDGESSQAGHFDEVTGLMMENDK
jgi:hypothetical protein